MLTGFPVLVVPFSKGGADNAEPSGSIFTNAYFSPQERMPVMYYLTGVSLQSMPAMQDITRKLRAALAVVGS